jgi:hypothetical protein
MPIAVANRDFPVALMPGEGQSVKSCQVANGEDLKLLSGRLRGVVRLGGTAYNGTQVVVGYLVEVEGQTVFIDEGLLEVSK